MTRLDLTLTWILCFELNWTETQVYHHVRCQFSQVLGEALIHYVWSKDIKLNDNACAIPIESVWVTNLLSTKVIVLLLILFILVLHCYCSLQTKPIHSIALHCIALPLHCVALHCIAIALHCIAIALHCNVFFIFYFIILWFIYSQLINLVKLLLLVFTLLQLATNQLDELHSSLLHLLQIEFFVFLFYFFILFYFILLFKYPKYTVHQKQ